MTSWKEPTAEHNFNEVVEAIKATWHVFSSIFSLFFVCISKLKRPIGRIIPRQIILCAAQYLVEAGSKRQRQKFANVTLTPPTRDLTQECYSVKTSSFKCYIAQNSLRAASGCSLD